MPRLRLVGPGESRKTDGEPLDDVRLVAALRAGEPGMAGMLHDRARPVIQRTVERLLGAYDNDVEDLIQVAMIELLRSIGRYRGECSLDTWSATIAANVVYKHIRRRGLERSFFAREALPEDVPHPSQPQPVLRAMVERIAHHLQQMAHDRAWTFLLHDVHGYSLEEVAAMTGVSLAAAQSRLVRGRRELHERIAADPGLAGGLDSTEEPS
jgi:RNA polymerase sigma-70 factor (ECF subfamily)